MSMDYIRKTYGVPARRGGRVAYTRWGRRTEGTITGSRDGWLRIRLDGSTSTQLHHPTQHIEYLA